MYPLLKKAKFRDTTLALIGLVSRMLGRAYLALVWNTVSVFGCMQTAKAISLSQIIYSSYVSVVFCDMFSRFAAAALRSLMSQQVSTFEQGIPRSRLVAFPAVASVLGKIFALVAIVEGITSLLASATFNSFFPVTLSFFPQLCYIILAVIMIFPIICIRLVL